MPPGNPWAFSCQLQRGWKCKGRDGAECFISLSLCPDFNRCLAYETGRFDTGQHIQEPLGDGFAIDFSLFRADGVQHDGHAVVGAPGQ